MTSEQVGNEVQKLNIVSGNRLAEMLSVPKEKLVSLSATAKLGYDPFPRTRPLRPFQKSPASKPRQIDNPQQELSWLQKRIHKRLLRPICFPEHVLGGVKKRSVLDNAERHLDATLLVTLDITACFPSISNLHVYRVWRNLLGCSLPVAELLTRLTTYDRHLPQGAATSPLLANLFIWMIDEPIRKACADGFVTYSTWIDDLAFSGEHARDLIQVAASTLAHHGLHISRRKIKIMGASAVKLLTGTRLGQGKVRTPKDKLSRIRSGIHKLREGLIPSLDQEKYIQRLVAQLRFVEQLCPKDARFYTKQLSETIKGKTLSKGTKRNIAAARDRLE